MAAALRLFTPLTRTGPRFSGPHREVLGELLNGLGGAGSQCTGEGGGAWVGLEGVEESCYVILRSRTECGRTGC